MKQHFKNRAAFDAAVMTGRFDGQAIHLLILHDDSCLPERCTCEPELVAEDLTEESYMKGQRAQADWVKGAARRSSTK